ncbi:MAG: hypothetical protein K2P09_05735, partial [Erysipelotrichales bacterium]|nr:hypothetical protein [Erysipelotrichales bacterium]
YYKEGEGKKEMCEIWDKIRRDGEALGEVRGEAKGKEIGREEGKILGRVEGKMEGRLENLQILYNDGILTKEQYEKYTNDIQSSKSLTL